MARVGVRLLVPLVVLAGQLLQRSHADVDGVAQRARLGARLGHTNQTGQRSDGPRYPAASPKPVKVPFSVSTVAWQMASRPFSALGA